MERNKEIKINIKDIVVLESPLHKDNRGYFTENWRKDDLIKNGVPVNFFKKELQNNISLSKKGVIRGMHFQDCPKLFTVVQGKFRMCFVDLRENSETFKNIFYLDVKPGTIVYMPSGVANGVQSLENNGYLNYLVKCYYDPKYVSMNPLDEDLNLPWVKDIEPILSEKDKNGISYKEMLKKTRK